ncbi:hypothetical protein BC629DRAFT_307345 [Irpex lacteus]|nr:hypothetical protein BC629DRAFT_307345 [Irpex lacteus]
MTAGKGPGKRASAGTKTTRQSPRNQANSGQNGQTPAAPVTHPEPAGQPPATVAHRAAATNIPQDNDELEYLDPQLREEGTTSAPLAPLPAAPANSIGQVVSNAPAMPQPGVVDTAPGAALGAGPVAQNIAPEVQFDLELAVNPQVDLAALAANLQAIQAQLNAFTAPPTTPGADRFTNATGRRLVVPTLSDAPGSVPKPRGSAGGGQRGYHLQAAMGLAGPEGDQLYNMILSTVRELVHAARIDLSREYRHVSAEVLSRVFASARRIHPYLARFERDWATAAIVKQYMSSARRYGRRKNYFPPPPDDNAPGPSRRRNLDDM